ncbi:CGNR zinc finger domain-containing protein [Mycolicibacterium sp. 050158]|uniref:CGNR zinc finger domain-containing protein n=1 Tax=Mycolicibacterium sp. 050158 TaxID=3090602 RepID=UPI00299E2420|nr:CGNR zinc finger domain-containing protein [Mycolicibacterium sp. 050158]MDX1888368.1 CGNR zinc finger domain-containing protein [Mycolicibacterium sp. 050158]
MRTHFTDVLLDLLNTTPVVDGADTDLLADDDGARRWLRAHDHSGADLDAVRAVRDDLQAVVRGQAGADVLDRHLAGVRKVPRISGDGLQWSLEAAGLSARVVLAWGELQNERPGRLRPCANGECHLFLLDRSRGGTGRWCSMSECGNRMKARRHYGRTAGRAT